MTSVCRVCPSRTSYRASSASPSNACSARPPPARTRSLTRMPGSSGYSPSARTRPATRTIREGSVLTACSLSSSMIGARYCSRPVSRSNTMIWSRGVSAGSAVGARRLPRFRKVGRDGFDPPRRPPLSPDQDVMQVRIRLQLLDRRQDVREPQSGPILTPARLDRRVPSSRSSSQKWVGPPEPRGRRPIAAA